MDRKYPQTPERGKMALKSLNDLFVHMLKDIYYAEKQILKELPKMSRKAGSEELKQALDDHREETVGQVERLEKVFEIVGKKARGEPCEGIQGLAEEAKEIMEEAEDPDVLDAGIIASAQAVEHYEITRYGTLMAWAEQLGMKDAAKLLKQTLDEEYKADKLLSKLAEGKLNREAA